MTTRTQKARVRFPAMGTSKTMLAKKGGFTGSSEECARLQKSLEKAEAYNDVGTKMLKKIIHDVSRDLELTDESLSVFISKFLEEGFVHAEYSVRAMRITRIELALMEIPWGR